MADSSGNDSQGLDSKIANRLEKTREFAGTYSKRSPVADHEMLFMFSKSPKYDFFREHLAGEEDVWTIPSRSKVTNGRYSGAFPEALVERCLRVGCIEGGAVMDPFAGSGTVLRVALRSGRPATGIDINPEFCNYVSEQLSQL